MKVSVALAYYNGGKYIDEQLDSILSQIRAEDELILSVDAADDGSADHLQRLAEVDGRVRVLEGPGKGVVRNFEHAIGACSGDLIFLADQDDIWEWNKVKKVLWAFDRSGAAAVLHNAVLVDEKGNPTGDPDIFSLRMSNTGLTKNFLKNSYVGCCMAFRRELCSLILPFPDRLYMHDYWIGTAAELSGGVALLKEPLVRYRRHGNNVSELTHGSLSFMLKKRLDILYCLGILRKRAAAKDRRYGTGAK